MTITKSGEALDSPYLKAALVTCDTCNKSELYFLGTSSGDAADMMASADEVSHAAIGEKAEITICGFSITAPWPKDFLKPNTRFIGPPYILPNQQ